MSLPFFYTEELNNQRHITLDEDTSKHITQVLRMKTGAELMLTNGKGNKAKAVITTDHRKKCEVKIVEQENIPPTERKVTVAISLLKNATRFEWFLEKATEIGVLEIVPLICSRTEKEKFRYDRMKSITVSAMLQSQQCWLPLLHQPTDFENVIQSNQFSQINQKFIAHCAEEQKQELSTANHQLSSIILIGPEGDFTQEEINMALQHQYQPVTLGNNRLRTETAGIVAATLLCCS